MSFIGDLFGTVKGLFTSDPLGALGSAASMAMGIGATKRQKKLMDYQDKINDENYQREREDKLSDYQMQLADQKAMIADERQYNSIGSQMQRARSADVSPLAALGVSSGSTLSAVSPVQGTSSQGVSQGSNDSSSHMSNAITLATTLKELKQRDKQLQIEKERADADNALKREQERKTNVERLLLEIEKSFKDDQEKARLKGMLADNDIKGVEKSLKEQEHEQKQELFSLEKDVKKWQIEVAKENVSKIKSETAVNNFRNYYERKYNRQLPTSSAVMSEILTRIFGSDEPPIGDNKGGFYPSGINTKEEANAYDAITSVIKEVGYWNILKAILGWD